MHFTAYVLRNYSLSIFQYRDIDCEDEHDQDDEDLRSDTGLLSEEETSENLQNTRVVHGPHKKTFQN